MDSLTAGVDIEEVRREINARVRLYEYPGPEDFASALSRTKRRGHRPDQTLLGGHRIARLPTQLAVAEAHVDDAESNGVNLRAAGATSTRPRGAGTRVRCTHQLARHDKQGRCHERVEIPTAWDENKKPLRFWAEQCNCRQYVDPQPLSQVYAENLTDRR